MPVRRVALLTAGGLAPCLSSAVGGLIERYTALAPDVEIIGYLDGYAGLLAAAGSSRSRRGCASGRTCCTGSAAARSATAGSSSPTSRTPSSAGSSSEGQDPLEVAAEQLTRDGVDVLHTIGGDDTNTTAADLAAYLHEERPRAHRRRAAEDDRQRRRADQAEPRRVDGGRAGRALRPQHRRRALVEPADARRPRGHGPGLRLADRRDRAALPRAGSREQRVRRVRQRAARAGTCTASTCRSSASTSTPRPSGCGP